MRGDILARAKETDRFTISRIEFAKRGAIFSSDGKPLAQDDDTFEFGVRFDKVPKSDAFFMALGEASDVPAAELSQLSRSGVKSRTWRRAMSMAQSQAIQRVKAEWRADGVSLSRTGRRAYPLSASAAPFIGVVRDGKPLAGLEMSQNKQLSGQNGKTVGLVDRLGAFLTMRLDPESKQKQDGHTLTLTIDSNLQQEATAALKVAVEKANADSGVALIMDPHTGDLLAMASWPSYDPNDNGAGIAAREHSDYNPNYMSVLEPGSTFKILTLAKALDEGVLQTNEVVHCGGGLQVWAGRSIHCDAHHGNRAHGTLTPEMAIAKSCNVSAATWAGRIGHPRMVGYLEDLGLLEKTHMGVPLEVAGQFNRNEFAKPLQLATVGFGQSVSCTPVGLISAFAMLANDGKRPQPRLIKKIGDKEVPLAPQQEVVKPETAHKVMDFMESVFSSDAGTAKGLRIPGYRLAGKTGTAERVRSKGGGGYVSNFVGYVPAENPRALILVMVDNPKGAYYGAIVAGPVFKDLAAAVIRRYAIPPSKPAASPQAKKN
jgi:cell division protein FtsI (penicillin-binding protein 3)